MNVPDHNQEKNKNYYEKLYSNYSVNNILFWLKNLDSFIATSKSTELSWFALYQDDFENRIKGMKVLEMGCGDCVNAAIMAGLDAEVYANDIASSSGEIINKLNANFRFKYPIKFIEGDFLHNKLPSKTFDFVIGKAFLHHLTIPVEKLFLQETKRLLKPEGEARFFEPAVNSKILDEIRWHIPVKGRPSKFRTEAFKKWKEDDPHPDRIFSSNHWEAVGKEYFPYIEIIPVGTMERFSRLFPMGEKQNRFKRWALKNEKYIPFGLNKTFARGQLIIYKNKE